MYVLLRGTLRRELLAALRQARKARRPRSRGVDQPGQFPHITSMTDHPAEVRAAGPRPLRWRLPQGCSQWLDRRTLVQAIGKDLAFSPIRSITAEHLTNTGNPIRSHVNSQEMLFSYVSSESSMPTAHLLRHVKAVADQVLQGCHRPSPRYTASQAAPRSHQGGWTPTSSFASFWI